MKIISNYKDYYDYLQGIYGIDELIVYDRVCQSKKIKPYGVQDSPWEKQGQYKPMFCIEGNPQFYTFSICGYYYEVSHYKGKFYYDSEIDELCKDLGLGYWDNQNIRITTGSKMLKSGEFVRGKSDVNIDSNCPIVLTVLSERMSYKNVKLSDFNFGKVYNPEKLFIDIGTFLSKEKVITDNRTDIQKLENAGFDKKSSFRNVK